jgi:ATP-dependent helicase/nuclease subunit B
MGKKSKFQVRDNQASFPLIRNQESGIRNHRIFAGSFAALERQWIEVIADLQREDSLREIHVLVGSNILALYLKRRLAENGRIAANIRFHTFLDLTRRSGTTGNTAVQKPRLPRPGPSVILADLLADKTPPIYGALSGYQGFRDALLETFRDLRDAGFTPRELERAVEKWKNPDRRPHLQGFAELYRRYRDRVGLFHDADDDFRDAIRKAAGSLESTGSRQMFIYGLYDVTGQQSLLLRSLQHSRDLTYFIPFVSDAVSEFARPFLESRANELGVQPVHLEPAPPAGSLGLLTSVDFGFSGTAARSVDSVSPVPRSMEDDGSFILVSAPGESRAAVEMLREIFRAVHDGTIRGFHEAAVVLRQPESDIPILVETLRLRGVPYFIHGGSSFADRPLGKAVVALSQLETLSFAREAVLAAMELVAAALPENSADRWDVQSWRALTNNSRFLAGLESWDRGTAGLLEETHAELEKAEAQPDANEDEDSESAARWPQMIRRRIDSALLLRDAWRQIRQAAAGWPASLPWDQWATVLEERLTALLGETEDWPSFSSILDEIGSLSVLHAPDIRAPRTGTDDSLSVDRLRSALFEAIAARACPVGSFQRSGVNLLSTSAARGLRFPLVLVPGLDEGRFPAKLRQDPLLLDAERASMGTLPVKSRRIEEEKLLFDMVARSAEKRLVLLTSRLDESSDRERIPSQFFLRVASAVRGGAVTVRDLAQGSIPGFRSVSLDNPAPAQDEIPVDRGEIRLRIVTATRESAHAALITLARMEPFRFSRPLQYDQSRWAYRLTAFDGLIKDPALVGWTAKRLGIAAGQVSASRLEEYVKCPYAFFLKRAMDLQAWEEQGKIEGMDPRDRGTAIHSILERFLRDFGKDVFQNPDEKLRQALESQARAILNAARPSGLADLLWEVERDALLQMLTGWLEFEHSRADADMRATRLEQVFGEFSPEEKFPIFRVQAGRHTFNFRGRIDRVDVSGDRKRARVVDYKTGSLPDTMAQKATRSPLMSGERIQLLIYSGALSVLEEFKEVETIEGEYLHLQPKDGLTVPCSFTHDELQKAMRALPNILEMVGDGIESGIFFARTSGRIRPAGHCEYCDFLPVCGKDRIQREERKAKDPAVQKFLQTVEPL